MSFLFVDRLLSFSEPSALSGVKHVTADEHYMVLGDWDSRRIWMPTLVGEAVGQLAAWYAMQALDFKYRPVAGVVDAVEVFGHAGPGDSILLKVAIEKLDETAIHYHGSAWLGEHCIMRIHHALGPMMPMATLIEQAEVRWQYQQLQNTLDDSPPECTTLPADAQAALLPQFDIRPPYPGGSYDRVFDLVQDKGGYGQKLISRSAPYFADHFPLKPVLPLTLLMQANHQLAAIYLQTFYPQTLFKLCDVKKVKMNQFVCPGQVVTTEMKQLSAEANSQTFRFKSFVGNQRVAVMQMSYQAWQE